MIIGDSFAYAHLPRTGGDAATIYFPALTECKFDAVTDGFKHGSFWFKRESHPKLHKLCGIRRLPEWTRSLMTPLLHPNSKWIVGSNNVTSTEFMLGRAWGDQIMFQTIGSTPITHWIRAEHLFEDIVSFIRNHVHEVSDIQVEKARSLPTKPSMNLDNPFTETQIEQLYDMNPHWAAVESQVYDKG